jgi:predicted permease
MSLFAVIFFKIISVLLSVILGYIGGKAKIIERDSIASLLLYLLSPVVFFAAPASTNVTLSNLSLTFIMFLVSCGICLATYKVLKKYWDDDTPNLLAMSAGTGNMGYFMLPIASFLLDEYALSIYMMSVIGINLYESSLGYYICARSVSSTQESIKKVLKLPMLQSFMFGCLFSASGFTLPDFLDDFIYNIRGAYSVLGMMMIGLGMSKLSSFSIDYKFAATSFTLKFLVYPVIINILIILDKVFFGFYGDSEYNALRLICVAPIASNTISFSSGMNIKVEHVASTVLASCLFVLIYIPSVLSILMSESGY